MSGRLNSFQRTMLQWNEMHPYNAAHVVRMEGGLRVGQLQRCLSATLEQRGFRRIALNGKDHTYRYENGAVPWEVKNVGSGAENPIAAVRAEVERQLNTPFDCTGRFNPLRFFAVPDVGSFYLGIVYFHAIADAESIVQLLRRLVQLGRQAGSPEPPQRLDLYPTRRVRLLSRHSGVLARRLLALPAHTSNLRRSYRPQYRDALDFHNGYLFFSVAPELLDQLVSRAKSWSVSVNDLLLALLMKSVAAVSEGRSPADRRNHLSIGCVANLRQELGIDRQRTFGLFLGSFTVTHAVPEEITLHELTEDIHRQTAEIKRRRLFLASSMELAFGRFMLRFFSPKRQKTFYQKYYPLAGGLTNMNLNSVWGTSKDTRPMDYLRAVSTGPVTPLVLSVTTVRDRMNIGISYRSAAYSSEAIERMKAGFMQQLVELRELA